MNYATFEEVIVEDVQKADRVYQCCLELMPHENYTFAKVWLGYANFKVRRENLANARKILDCALKLCPKVQMVFTLNTNSLTISACFLLKEKLLRGYIDLEIQLRDFERCRKLFESYVEYKPGIPSPG